jgi:hypothetical protein
MGDAFKYILMTFNSNIIREEAAGFKSLYKMNLINDIE